jgi:hypothetical protein
MSSVTDDGSVGSVQLTPLEDPPVIQSPQNLSFSQRFQRVTNRLRIATSLTPSKPDLKYSTEGWHDTPSLAQVEQSVSARIEVRAPGKRRTKV